jgi:hypothetical protein
MITTGTIPRLRSGMSRRKVQIVSKAANVESAGGGSGSGFDWSQIGDWIGAAVEGVGVIVEAEKNAQGQVVVTTDQGSQFVIVDGQAYPLGYVGPSFAPPATNGGNGNGNGFGAIPPLYIGIGVLALILIMRR